MTVLAILSGGEYISLPDPKRGGYNSIPQEISTADRNVEGTLIKDRVAIKGQVTVAWTCLTPAQKNLILSLTSPNSFGVRYFDMSDDAVKYATMYRGNDLKIDGRRYYDPGAGAFSLYDVSMSLTEF